MNKATTNEPRDLTVTINNLTYQEKEYIVARLEEAGIELNNLRIIIQSGNKQNNLG